LAGNLIPTFSEPIHHLVTKHEFHARYHKVPAGQKHVNNWSLDGVEGLPADGKLDVTKLGLGAHFLSLQTSPDDAMTPDDFVAWAVQMAVRNSQ
jgi:hypothetical protein